MALVSSEQSPIFQLLDLAFAPMGLEPDNQFQHLNFSVFGSPQSSPPAFPDPIFSSSRSRPRSPVAKRSWIWAHHAPNSRKFHTGTHSHWDCAYCSKSFKLVSGTGKPMRHLEIAHGILRPAKRVAGVTCSASTSLASERFTSQISGINKESWNVSKEQMSLDPHFASCTDYCGDNGCSGAFSNDMDIWLDCSHSGFESHTSETASISPTATSISTFDSGFEDTFSSAESSPSSYMDHGSNSLSRSPPTKSASFTTRRSWIWQHHESFSWNDEGSSDSDWRCAYCWKVYRKSSGTGKGMKHLRDAHGFVC
ncbi:uncharacterized protein LY89DRAFT_146514 [Mollisia scopiformis]|uniref:BED-type domain-containing protein n=1 Tax=Mollisia scopiformis TaxID=149040 RepID=A0A194X0L9_MOLSC|nr:uncharacterized protein LY89DRAFT_146514 [Mollisia scopiformis]KUJ13743.1 hypothetical protein LY89DRAFT_146514 [Mollisia scopiformis]